MRTLTSLFLWIPSLCLFLAGCNNHTVKEKNNDDSAIIHRLNDQLSETILFDGFSPPVASRIFAYTNIAAYEAAVAVDTNYKSYKNQLNGLHDIATGDNKNEYVPEIAVVRAFCRTAVYFTYRDYMMDSIEAQLLEQLGKCYTENEMKVSIACGDTLAAYIIKWAAKDRYSETRKMSFYVLKKKEWTWELTPSQFMEAIEPNWNLIRPFVLDSASQFRPSGPPPFSKEKNSVLYKEAMIVYNASGKVMGDTAAANFWDCNPFSLKREGHISYFKRQISPGAHWMGITKTACKLSHKGLKASCEIYSRTAITLADAFIRCWDTKYYYDFLRPITYINRYIDPNWKPLLETPPFPEYSSGHSAISRAAATVLTGYFGDNFHYTDSVELPFGKAPRSFNSFMQASEEAALSRLYGGIHYTFSINDGKAEGDSVGRLVLKKITTSKVKSTARL